MPESLPSFEPLRSKRFAVFLAGSFLSNIGTWMQQVAEPWLILSLTGSSMLLGVDSFVMDAPLWILTFFGGLLADRRDRRKIIFFFQSIQMFCPIALIVLIWMGKIQAWMIIGLSLIVGITDALSMPSFQSIVPSIAPPGQVGKAIALNSTQMNLSRVLGPALAGLVMIHFGPVGCFGINALSYVPFIFVVYWIHPLIKRKPATVANKEARIPLFAGFREIGSHVRMQNALLTVLVTSLLCGPLIIFCPVLVKEVFHSDAGHFGDALAAFGIGGVLGAVTALATEGRVNRTKLCSWLAMLCGGLVVLVALNRSLTALSLLLVLSGAALTASNILANSILQSFIQDRLRGQTSSLFMLAIRGGHSIGSLLTALSTTFFGIGRALFINGVLAVMIQLLIFWRWQQADREN